MAEVPERTAHSLATLTQDLHYALRMMRRAPGFIALLSLGLGIGANAIFSLIHTLMLRLLLPVRDPQQLVELLNKYRGEPHVNGFSWQSYFHNHVLAALIESSPVHLTVRAEGLDPEIEDGEYVVSNFFPVLGVTPAVGRLTGPEDDATAAVVSWSYWKSRFNLDPAIGLYGLLAYTVARRIPEIGVRMALGAGRGQVLRMVISDALGTAAASLAISVPVALRARRFAASLIPGLPLNSVFPIALSAVAILAVALLAAFRLTTPPRP
jgi:hypothetical protein